ncbi:Uncharacterised protein [uncultured archaeon]|nr:Uncharacterised protein [uncultured archaeon]
MQIDDILKQGQFRELDLFLTEKMNNCAGTELVEKMIELWESEKDARDWFYTPLKGLEGKRPYDYCREGKIDEVGSLLGRIAAGVYS